MGLEPSWVTSCQALIVNSKEAGLVNIGGLLPEGEEEDESTPPDNTNKKDNPPKKDGTR